MQVRDFAFNRGREIGAVADTDEELQDLVTAFMRGHPEVAGDPEMVETMWRGIAATHPEHPLRH